MKEFVFSIRKKLGGDVVAYLDENDPTGFGKNMFGSKDLK